MRSRSLAFALSIPLFLAGCSAPETSNADDEQEVDPTPEIEIETTGGGAGPNMAAMPFGTWDYTMTEVGGDEVVTGVLVLDEGRAASRMTMSSGIDAPLMVESFDVTNQNFVLSGTIAAESGAMSVTLAGSLNGSEMSAEANVGGMGAYALSGTRRAP